MRHKKNKLNSKDTYTQPLRANVVTETLTSINQVYKYKRHHIKIRSLNVKILFYRYIMNHHMVKGDLIDKRIKKSS